MAITQFSAPRIRTFIIPNKTVTINGESKAQIAHCFTPSATGAISGGENKHTPPEQIQSRIELPGFSSVTNQGNHSLLNMSVCKKARAAGKPPWVLFQSPSRSACMVLTQAALLPP